MALGRASYSTLRAVCALLTVTRRPQDVLLFPMVSVALAVRSLDEGSMEFGAGSINNLLSCYIDHSFSVNASTHFQTVCLEMNLGLTPRYLGSGFY